MLDGTSGNALSQGYLLGLVPKYKQAAYGVNSASVPQKNPVRCTNGITKGQEYYKSRGFFDKEASLLEQRDKYREQIGDRFAYKADIDPEEWLDNEIEKLEQEGFQFSEALKKQRKIEKSMVEKGNEWAAEVAKMGGKIPCSSVVYDPLLNEYYFTRNYKTKDETEIAEYKKWAYGSDSKSAIHPILKERLNMYEADIKSGKVTLPINCDKRLAAHSEVIGLDLALKGREAKKIPVNEESINELYVYNVYLPELKDNERIVPFVRCPHCKRLTDGIITVHHG